MAIGNEFDGKTSLIVGTHTHVPTADGRILPNGTAYISDLGMCGDYNSIIGMDKIKSLERAGVSISPTPAMIGETLLETIAD